MVNQWAIFVDGMHMSKLIVMNNIIRMFLDIELFSVIPYNEFITCKL